LNLCGIYSILKRISRDQYQPSGAQCNNVGTRHKDVQVVEAAGRIVLATATYEEARDIAPGWDIYHLEGEWKVWMSDGGLDAPKNPDRAFLGFCRKWFEKRGRP
jgi:hypothetical protein